MKIKNFHRRNCLTTNTGCFKSVLGIKGVILYIRRTSFIMKPKDPFILTTQMKRFEKEQCRLLNYACYHFFSNV